MFNGKNGCADYVWMNIVYNIYFFGSFSLCKQLFAAFVLLVDLNACGFYEAQTDETNSNVHSQLLF